KWPARKGRIQSAERAEAHPIAEEFRESSFSLICGRQALQRKEFAVSDDSQEVPRQLPDRPNLRHLKDQARDLLKTGGAKSLTDAQFKIARLYGFASWPKLKAHVESLKEIGSLKQAIDSNDVNRVKAIMTRNPTLHRAPLGYGQGGPLTW